jgi:DHA2 family metal-tetracycline-proton antiporter-like MFS transporter
MVESAPTTHPRVSPGVVLAVVVPAMLLMVVASDMVTLVLPRIGQEFGAPVAQLAWIVTGFLLVFSIGIPFYGRISDHASLQRLFGLALLGYAAGSLICAVAPALAVLVLGRIVTGAGAAAVPVLSVVAVTRVLPEGRRGVGIGLIGAAGGVGAALGPVVGGVIGQFLGWRALFWIMMLLALVLLSVAMRVLPADAPGGAGRFDVAGGIFLGLAAGLVLFGITEGQVAGFSAPSSWGSLVTAAVAGAGFAWRTRVAAHPFVPPSLFRNRVYVAAGATVFLSMFVNLAALVFVPVLVVAVNGISPGAGSLVMIPGGIAVAVLAPLAGRVADRAGARPVAVTGLAVVGLSSAFLSIYAGASSFLAGVGVLGVGAGFVFAITAVTTAAATTLPAGQVGAGLGIFQGAQFLGGGTGPALAGVLLDAREASGAPALNPLHAGAAPAFSDVFLMLTAVVVLGVLMAFGLRART